MSTAEQHGSKDTEADPSVSRRSPGWWCVVQHCVELRRLRSVIGADIVRCNNDEMVNL
jgi:hypothetical protein